MTTQSRIYTLDDLYEQRFAPIATLDLSRVALTIEAYAADLTTRVNEMLNDFTEEQTLSRSVWGGAPQMAFDEVGEGGRAKPRADVQGQEVHFPLFKLSATQEASEEFWRRAKGQNVIDLLTAMDIGYSARIRDEIKAAIFNNALHTKVTDWLIDKSTLNKVQPFLNADGASIPPAPNGTTFTASTHQHYIGITGSTVASSDINTLLNTVREHGEGQVVLYVDPAMPSTMSGLSGNKWVGLTPTVVVDQTNAQVSRAQFDPAADRSNMLLGYWDGHPVVTRSWVPTNYMVAMNISGRLGKPLHRRIDPMFPGLRVAPEITNGILRVKESYFYMGFAAFNRAAGAVMDCTTGSNSYTVPSGLIRS